MDKNSWVIILDERRVGGMLSAARALGGQVTAAVVGSSALAESVAGWGFDRVICFETAQDVPPEAYASDLAEAAAASGPALVMSSDAPMGRVLLGAVAARLGAAVVSAVRSICLDGDCIVASRTEADYKVLDDIECKGALAVIFDGEDVDVAQAEPVAVEYLAGKDIATMRLVETLEPEDSGGLLTALRVVGAGAGLASKDDLKLIEELAAAMNAEIGCSLPVCEDMRWMPASRVVGSTHVQVAPELYIAVGVSGQPQHLAGVRDARIVVGINKDPDARIFKNCNYGILGDLYKVVPELISAFKALE